MTDGVTSGNSQTLAYDALDRLHTASGGYGSETYAYDANGNRNSLNGTSWTYTANSNRLTAMGTTSVTTNANGSITGVATSPAMGFTFYKSGRLDTVTSGSGTVLTYTYDAFGRRATKVDTAQRFYQYAFDDKVLEESDNTYTTKLDTIYLGGLPVATFVPNGSTGTLSFLHTGKNDIPRLATNASQTTGWSFTTADPFAGGTATVSTISNDLRYPGQEYEMATGQFYNRNRDYAPGWGRYLESDPIGLNGGQASTYAYAGNNPQKFIDFRGLADQTETDQALRDQYANALNREANADDARALGHFFAGTGEEVVGNTIAGGELSATALGLGEAVQAGAAVQSVAQGMLGYTSDRVFDAGVSGITDPVSKRYLDAAQQQFDEFRRDVALARQRRLQALDGPTSCPIIWPLIPRDNPAADKNYWDNYVPLSTMPAPRE